ncbi:MAG: CoA-binding protein [Bacteroidetes bacterium GWF2_42_66]|nr:MAG: CoA-binding protein [Bacteroidetes bacterium GWA2_42_15]OFX99984.1 MAG: CoA-binding protein [Bacteroidetes bacterium GWE2_42_39]OFY40170.1 MAG: CoA-binding protein [Bacteroidetes bacterium GWF2_42_66]HBL73999.1 CoA-binding protein [Prolixibacteraceae bacterium]HCR91903.1 CoA-binding protein [Prolixibacteraceae bacterium]
MERTLVIGASENPERYSNMAVRSLQKHGHEVLAIGAREGYIGDVKIENEKPSFENIDTVTLYVGPRIQPDYYGYVGSLRPRRVIFNPGTENPEFERELEESGVEVLEACTLVLLSTGEF